MLGWMDGQKDGWMDVQAVDGCVDEQVVGEAIMSHS